MSGLAEYHKLRVDCWLHYLRQKAGGLMGRHIGQERRTQYPAKVVGRRAGIERLASAVADVAKPSA